MNKKMIYVGVVAAAVLGGYTLTANSAQASAGRNGVCETGEFCLYFNSNQQGSVSDFTDSVSDYGTTLPTCYVFKGSGAGQGECMKNQAASVRNRTSVPVTVYFNSGFGGASQTIAAGASANLNATLKNQNASHRFGSSGTDSRQTMSAALYGTSGGYLVCGFDGYVNTAGRHEGIDFARQISSPVRALVGGTVVNVVRGSNGSGGLSTIAVYDASSGKTVVYLHTAPLSGLSAGQQVSRGQQIATEAWRGVSSSSGAHTHVEMRPGRQALASKSVNDYTLDNPNPTSFWTAEGYRIA